MRIYMADTPDDRLYSGWLHCLNWAQNRVQHDHYPIVQIFKLRAGEKEKRIVAEVTAEGTRIIKNGRIQKMTKEDRYGLTEK